MVAHKASGVSMALQMILLAVLATTLLAVAVAGVVSKSRSSDAGAEVARGAGWAVSMTGGPERMSLDGTTDTAAVYTYAIGRTSEVASECTDIVMRLDRALPPGVSVSLYAQNDADPSKSITVTDPSPTSAGQVYTFHIGNVGYADSLSGGIHGTLTFTKDVAITGEGDVNITLEAVTVQVD